MSCKVPLARSISPFTDIQAGRIVRSPTWESMGNTLNWALGTGNVLIPASSGQDIVLLAGSTSTFKYKVTPSERSCQRVWVISCYGHGTLTVTDLESNSQSFAISARVDGAPSDGRSLPPPIVYRESLTAKTGVATEIYLTLAVSAGASASVTIASIACYDCPRAYLDKNATDNGVDILYLDVRSPINSIDNESVSGIITGHMQANWHKQYLAMAKPMVKGSCWSNSTVTYTYALKEGILLGRKLAVGATTTPITFRFLCSTSSASYGGTIKITNIKNGLSYEKVIAASAPLAAGFLWYEFTQADYDLLWECEDYSAYSGNSSGTWQTFNIEIKSSNAAGTFYLASIIAED